MNIEKLENNLKQKIRILESVYESDKRFVGNFNEKEVYPEYYDEYMNEHDSYLEALDELDTEFDEIYAGLSSTVDVNRIITQQQKQEIGSLIKEVEGKILSVDAAEEEVRKISDDFFKKRKSEIASSRKTARVIQNHYGSNAGVIRSDNNIFDTSK